MFIFVFFGAVLFMFVTFFILLFLVTFLYVDDLEMSAIIFFNEIRIAFFVSKKKRILDSARFISGMIRSDMKKIIRKKDEDLMQHFSLKKDEVTRLKKAAEEIARNKEVLLISLEDTKALLESIDKLSFLGSYKIAIQKFSEKENIIIYKEQSRKNRVERYKQLEKELSDGVLNDSKEDLIKNLATNKFPTVLC